ncbi:MAG: hypothetical protein ACOCRK_01385 [bacterium]
MPTVLESVNDFITQDFTKRERQLIYHLRVMLKDLPDDVYRSLNTLVEEQRGERWTDMQLLVYLNQAIADINNEPPYTNYSLENFPGAWKAAVINGSMIFALISEGILQIGEQFSYSDNGISLSVNLAQGYQSMAQMLMTGYNQLKSNIKRAMRPHAAGLRSSPSPVRIRSYAPRMWTYR